MHKCVYPDLVRQVHGEIKEMNYGDYNRRLNFDPVSFKYYVLSFSLATKDAKLHTRTNNNELSSLDTEKQTPPACAIRRHSRSASRGVHVYKHVTQRNPRVKLQLITRQHHAGLHIFLKRFLN